MRPSDLELLAVPGRLALRGELLLAAVSRPCLDTDRYTGTVRRIGFDGTDRAWTHGDHDSAPSISPDGRWVAFLRRTGGDPAQLHVMPSDGGEARRLTGLPLGAGEPVWAPDSRRIAFTARIPEPGRYGTADSSGESVAAEAEAPRLITRLDYRLDDIGFLGDRRLRLFVADVFDGATTAGPSLGAEALTDGEADVEHPVWTPDGERVLVVAGRDWGREDGDQCDVYAIPAAGGAPELVVRMRGYAERLCADGGSLFFYGTEFSGPGTEIRNVGLFSASLPEPGSVAEARRLTDAETVDCDPAAGPPVPLGDDLLVAVRTRGAVELRAVPRTAAGTRLDGLRLLGGERARVTAFAADGRRVAAAITAPDSRGDVCLLGSGPLTDWSKPLRDKGIRPLTELTATSADGYPVHGWLVLPEGDGPHPVLLVVHGGPFADYGWGLFDEAQVYASAGYAVVLPNPRGSAGYGESHGRAILHALGTVDADDLLALLDAALERPDLDRGRTGVMGGSYGGFMTGWLAAHHGGRFRAAWSERAVNAWDSFTGSSDIGWKFARCYVGDDPAEQRARSPLTHADRIGIPFAVVHLELDWRCPVEQAQRMFVALKRAGTETELLLFPGEGHELSRSGSPRHRLQRFEAVLDWWSRHL
ncbi:S9 family peptidase [Amycolatopsis sp. CA-230715]|uniref:S9 family peptidase n=1 Tax=Amycolatopsis sp. CA-230715 TaxID=2745196 RepID=UPI001C012CDA|nr:S9 family peptidase [Amycolatopsis sp. CA-230715]QWF77229.1 Dipeptidyl-peptidase 5 [Amycolatopsis sp. CA-230715]